MSYDVTKGGNVALSSSGLLLKKVSNKEIRIYKLILF